MSRPTFSGSKKEATSSYKQWASKLAEGDVVPAFQPILSVESQTVCGYEALGRLRLETGLESLGGFFGMELPATEGQAAHDAFDGLKLNVDHAIRAEALERFKQSAPAGTKLFINIPPSLMLRHMQRGGDALPFTLQLIESMEIDPARIVIEITEDRMGHDVEALSSLIDEYRAWGCSIAVDDVGVSSSNLDRIGVYHPDIIKIDLSLLRRSVRSRNFKEILGTLAHLSQSMGSRLLFEGVETLEELNNALAFGAQYIQGFYFARAAEHFFPVQAFKPAVVDLLSQFRFSQREEREMRIGWESRTRSQIDSLDLMARKASDGKNIDTKDLDTLDGALFRLYVTDLEGEQLSPNYVLDGDGGYRADSAAVGYNWCTRPYYKEHLYQAATVRDSWIVSSSYHDISEDLMLRTFSRTIDGSYILFLDIVTAQG